MSLLMCAHALLFPPCNARFQAASVQWDPQDVNLSSARAGDPAPQLDMMQGIGHLFW